MKIRGFTLIELMVVLVIVAILAAIAVPAFTDQMKKSRRSDAIGGLADLQLRQERWRSNHVNYMGTDSSAPNLTSFGGMPTSTFYTFAFDSVEAPATFTVKATAIGVQASDTACAIMRIQVNAGAVTKTPTTGRCWN